jgi:hypothetical protein
MSTHDERVDLDLDEATVEDVEAVTQALSQHAGRAVSREETLRALVQHGLALRARATGDARLPRDRT